MQLFLALSIILAASAAFIYQDFTSRNDAKTARDAIWNAIITSSTPGAWFPTWKILGLFLEDMNVSFDYTNDWLPRGRDKLIHTQGAIAQAVWEPVEGGRGYTGLFQSGDLYGFVRLSLAKQPSDKHEESATAPGLAVKFFRDNLPSTNFVAMYSLDESWNFFQNSFSNHVNDSSDALLKLLAKKFHTASKFESKAGLSDFAKYTSDGAPVESPKAPYRIILVPNEEIKKKVAEVEKGLDGTNWLSQFQKVPKGTVLYQVYAISEPSLNYTKGDHIANIVLSTDLITSDVADRHLFFQHVRMEEDFKLRPDWKPKE